MKVFRVVYEEDGETTREPGKVATDIRRCELRYAATDIRKVFEAIKWLLIDDERQVMAVIEEAPQITILQ